MVKIVPLYEQNLAEAIQLADATFRDAEQFSMADAFPFMYFKAMQGQSYAAFADGKMVSFLGLVPAVIRVGPARLNIFSLGSVCTDPDYRGRGIASAIMEKVLKHVDQSGASLLLVTGTRSLYTRVNCHLFGEVTRFTLDADSANDMLKKSPSADVLVRELKATDWLKLTEVAASRVARYEQSVWDLASLVNAEAYASCIKLHHKVLVAERDGEIKGFLVVGVPYQRGKKRQPMAFEWAGQADIVTLLLADAVKRYELEQLEVPVPWHEQSLLRCLCSLSARKEKNLGTVHIVQPERFISQLRPYLKEKNHELTDHMNIRSLVNGQIELNVDGKRHELESDKFVSLVFDPQPDLETNAPLQSLFPIPFPYTGGLNYV